MINPQSFPALAAKLSPAIYFIVVIFNAILNPGFDSIYLLVCYSIAFFSVPLFKDLIFKPIYWMSKRKELPILGLGQRPSGARSCSLSGTNEKSLSFGMPSGHSSLTLFITTYIILNIYYMDYSKYSNPDAIKALFSIICVLLMVTSIFIIYSRVKIAGCHTIQQVVVGSIIGVGLAYLAFYVKPVLQKHIE
jgi:membrane-associated phospholipid phosphatase